MLTTEQTNFILENLKKKCRQNQNILNPHIEHYTRSKDIFFLRQSVSSFVFMLDIISTYPLLTI